MKRRQWRSGSDWGRQAFPRSWCSHWESTVAECWTLDYDVTFPPFSCVQSRHTASYDIRRTYRSRTDVGIRRDLSHDPRATTTASIDGRYSSADTYFSMLCRLAYVFTLVHNDSLAFSYKLIRSKKQESPADAKVSARQQCVYKGPWDRNLQQFNTICDFL